MKTENNMKAKIYKNTFLVGRNPVDGTLVPLEVARKNPRLYIIENMPKKGRGDVPRKK